jgi:hypothetical protein
MKEKRKDIKVQIWEALEERGWVTPLSTPPPSFCEWWVNHDHCSKRIKGRDGRWGWTSGITAHKAWQCASYRDEFKERGHDFAAGTGVNYAYFDWHKPYPRPRELSDIQLRHQAWCKRHNKPDPFAEEQEIPKEILEVRSFEDMKKVLTKLTNKFDMNKAIGWTQADSDAANKEGQPF